MHCIFVYIVKKEEDIMKKFNKFLSVAVASAMVMSMAGCGNTDNSRYQCSN